MVDAVHERDADADGAGADGQRDNGHLGPAHGQQTRERATDAQVAVDGYRDHNEQRERDVERYQKLHSTTPNNTHYKDRRRFSALSMIFTDHLVAQVEKSVRRVSVCVSGK